MIKKILFISILLSVISCGKKTALETYKESGYPKQYPVKSNENY